MSFQPLSQTVTSGKTQEIPSSDAVYNAIATGVGTAFPYFGAFYSTQTQTNSPIDTPRAMTINSTSDNYHVSIQSNSQITFDYSGVYNIQFSAQFEKSTGTPSYVNIWLRENGIDVPWSDTKITLANSSKIVASWNFVVSVPNTNHIEIIWASSDSNVQILAEPPQISPYPSPAIPSVILTVTPVKAL
jgi:hypothetical protein